MPSMLPHSSQPSGSNTGDSFYSDKQVASHDYGKEVVASTRVAQPYPDAYAYANPNNTNNDSTRGGADGGGLESIYGAGLNDWNKQLIPEQRQRRRTCGLSRKTLIIVIAVVTALAVAAIIGGSIGGVMASKNSSNDSPSPVAVSLRTLSLYIC
jgi:hypothetical protein